MQRDARAYLTDVRDAATLIRQFVQGKTLADYRADPMLRSAVERQFEIIGEACNQLAKTAPTLSERIPTCAAWSIFVMSWPTPTLSSMMPWCGRRHSTTSRRSCRPSRHCWWNCQMTVFSESVVEDATLAWLESVGWSIRHSPKIAPGEAGRGAQQLRAGCAGAAVRDTLLQELISGKLWLRYAERCIGRAS